MNREQWLMAAVDHLVPIFEARGYSVPAVKVSVGFPSTGGKGRHLGQCWSSKSAVDGINQIFIAPHLQTPFDFLDTLVHELVHAVDDCASGHGEIFKKIAIDVGLKGPMRSAGAGDWLKQDLIRIVDKLGAFPHGRLSVAYGLGYWDLGRFLADFESPEIHTDGDDSPRWSDGFISKDMT